MRVLLVSCYELGHQPFALASAWGALEAAGASVVALDASLGAPEPGLVQGADLVAISVPMHTALRLGVPLAAELRAMAPKAHVCMFGLYAWMNATHLLDGAVDSILGGEIEPALVELASRLARGETLEGIDGLSTRGAIGQPRLEKTPFKLPVRHGLPPLASYARLLGPRPGEERIVGYTEATRGCRYRCRHCPVVPVYDGRFFVVPAEVVLADIDQQVALGARHITFGDPDFLNGPRHAMNVVRRLHAVHRGVSFDITVKIEHVLRHRELFKELGELGCAFMVSAVESLADRVLTELDKGHTRADVVEALGITREAGIPLRPSLVPFSPWATLDDYVELVDFVFAEQLTEHVDPIQLSIRLLVPPGSALLWPEDGSPRRPAGSGGKVAAELPAWVDDFDAEALGYRWTHPDPRMDALQREVGRAVEEGARDGADNRETLAAIRRLAYAAAGRALRPLPRAPAPAFVPRLTESWFCCAEPSAEQFERIARGRVEACGACHGPQHGVSDPG